ncbi:DsbA family protein [Lacrimispora sp. BS-2]|uniref:DsbA family protein n=1 Tax=Lacrimispora sp. BS-2 TaxID=3151850 RepID=A0AAU7PM50_9FIRM
MKRELHVFFDYICPYCLKAHKHLRELIPDYPDVTIVWHPCESHPRPDPYGLHSDLCIQGYFYAVDYGVDILEYHEQMYQAALIERINIENIDALTECVSDLVDADDFRLSLQLGTYRSKLGESNELAFEKSGVWAFPAFRMGALKLDAVENVGVSKEQILHLIKNHYI